MSPFEAPKRYDTNPNDDVTKTVNTYTINVSTAGSDTTGDGSLTNPYATAEGAIRAEGWTEIAEGDKVTIQYGAGTFYAEEIIRGLNVRGRLVIQGTETVLEDSLVISGYTSKNSDGRTELDFAGTPFLGDVYAKKFIRVEQLDVAGTSYYTKYFPIISHDNSQLVTLHIGVTPTIGETTISVIQLDTILSGATAGAPTVGSTIPFTMDRVGGGTYTANPGEAHVQYPIQFNALKFHNGLYYSRCMSLTSTNAKIDGCEFWSHADTNCFSGFYANAGDCQPLLVGCMFHGNLANHAYTYGGADASVYYCYSDYSGYTGGIYTHKFCYLASTGGRMSCGYNDVSGAHSSTFYSSRSGAYMYVSGGHVSDSANVIRAGSTAYAGDILQDQLYGTGNTSLYTSFLDGVLACQDTQANISYTRRHDIEDNSARLVAQDPSGNYAYVGRSREVSSNTTTLFCEDMVFLDSTGGAFNVMLPDDMILQSSNRGHIKASFKDSVGNCGTANVTILAQGLPAEDCTADNATNTFTDVAHGLLDDDRVKIGGDVLPTGITAATTYYIVNKAADTFQVSLTSGGAAVTFTDDGTNVTWTRYPTIDGALTKVLSTNYETTSIVANGRNYFTV